VWRARLATLCTGASDAAFGDDGGYVFCGVTSKAGFSISTPSASFAFRLYGYLSGVALLDGILLPSGVARSTVEIARRRRTDAVLFGKNGYV